MTGSLLFALATTAGAATLELQPVADTMLCENTNESNGAGDYLFVGNTGEASSVDTRRALLRYDIAGALPAGSTITSASITGTVSRSTGTTATGTLHRLNASWGEAGSHASGGEGRCATAFPGDATWADRITPGSPWSTAGGDFAASPSASTTMATFGDFTWGSTPSMVADVQGWLDSPATDFGWLVRGDEAPLNSAKRFSSRENFGGGTALTVDFDAPPLVLSSITPGVAGTVNSATISGGLPGGGVGLVYGTAAGSTAVPGCPGLVVDIDAALIADTGPMDATGTAVLGAMVPAGASGLTVLVQAVQPATCTVSNRVVHAFP